MSLVTVLLSSIFLVKGVITMSPKEILNLSGSFWDSNPYAVKSWCDQKADTVVGTALLILSFIFQILALVIDRLMNYKAIAILIIASAICFFIGSVISSSLEKYYHQQVLTYKR